jgi:hypothetical protein
MEYLLLGSILILVILLVLHQSNKRRTKKKIEQIRAAWGKPKTDSFDFDNIRRYSDAVKENTFHRLTDQTIEDIDLHGLFTFIDRSTSKVGQQLLFKKLLEPGNATEDPQAGFTKIFEEDKKLREAIQLELLKLNHGDAYYISTLLQDKLLEKPKWFNLLILDVAITGTLAILAFQFPVLLIFLIIPITLNMFLHYWNKSNTYPFIRSFPQLNLLINVSKVLTKMDIFFRNESVDSSIANLKSFQRKAALIKFDSEGGIQAELSQLGLYLVELLKAIFLIEVFTLFKVTKELESKQSSIKILFNYVGTIDVALSIVSLRAGEKKTCIPTLVPPKKELSTKRMYHPLIDDCMENDFSILEKSVLITGSNMSGKSTFLRTLLINSLLAQTIHTCFADEFVSPILKQFSSIRIDDNLFEGKSYYLQEVTIMGSLLEQVDSPNLNLFVLDEVFKGTNTIERIAAAKAILSYLNRNDNIVIVSTHDIELAEMLNHEYDLFHFTESVENNELHFDHIIKAGPLKTRNAIKILELANYPIDITQEAKQLSAALTITRPVTSSS